MKRIFLVISILTLGISLSACVTTDDLPNFDEYDKLFTELENQNTLLQQELDSLKTNSDTLTEEKNQLMNDLNELETLVDQMKTDNEADMNAVNELLVSTNQSLTNISTELETIATDSELEVLNQYLEETWMNLFNIADVNSVVYKSYGQFTLAREMLFSLNEYYENALPESYETTPSSNNMCDSLYEGCIDTATPYNVYSNQYIEVTSKTDEIHSKQEHIEQANLFLQSIPFQRIPLYVGEEHVYENGRINLKSNDYGVLIYELEFNAMINDQDFMVRSLFTVGVRDYSQTQSLSIESEINPDAPNGIVSSLYEVVEVIDNGNSLANINVEYSFTLPYKVETTYTTYKYAAPKTLDIEFFSELATISFSNILDDETEYFSFNNHDSKTNIGYFKGSYVEDEYGNTNMVFNTGYQITTKDNYSILFDISNPKSETIEYYSPTGLVLMETYEDYFYPVEYRNSIVKIEFSPDHLDYSNVRTKITYVDFERISEKNGEVQLFDLYYYNDNGEEVLINNYLLMCHNNSMDGNIEENGDIDSSFFTVWTDINNEVTDKDFLEYLDASLMSLLYDDIK